MKTTEWKDTEIGRIPKDWEVKPLGEVMSFKNGLNSDAQSYGDGYPLISVLDALSDNVITSKTIKSRVKTSVSEFNAFSVKRGDLIFVRSSETLEDVGRSNVYLDDTPAVFGGFVIRGRLKENIDPLYLRYLLSERGHRLRICSFGAGAQHYNISQEGLEKVLLVVSINKTEQQRIAKALSDIDMLITSLDKAIEKKRLVKQGAMQQLLTGKKRLKGFTGEWKEICLGEIGKVTSAGVDKTIKENEQPVRLVNFLDVYHRDYIRSRDLHHWVTASDNKVLSCDVKKGDIFLTPSSEMPDDIGRFAVAIEDIPDACYSYHVNRLRPAIKLDLQYSAFMLNTKEYQDQITTLSEGSGKRYVISKSKFEKVKIHIPMDLREQNAIGYVLTSITSEIDSLIHEREKYLRLKDGMMQELLTGKTRLI